MTASRGVVMIVEDSVESAALLQELVEGEGFRAAVCTTAAEALDSQPTLHPVVILLDWGLPDVAGIEVCRQIRLRDAAVPILFVSGREDEASVARGLEAGADDYVAKPVRPVELMARVEAHLRRIEVLTRRGNGADHARHVALGPLDIDLDAREVRSAGRHIALGALEYRLLEYLVTNAGTAVSRDQILSEVYGYDADISSERVDLLVRRLRSKLGAPHDDLIAAVPGYGYRLERRAGARA